MEAKTNWLILKCGKICVEDIWLLFVIIQRYTCPDIMALHSAVVDMLLLIDFCLMDVQHILA